MGPRRLTSSQKSPWIVSGALVLASLAFSQVAFGEPPVTVRIVPTPCSASAVDLGAFARTVTIELHADGIEKVTFTPMTPSESASADAPSDGASAVVEVAAIPCDESARDIDVTIIDLATRKTVRRRLSLADIAGQARPRALALAVAELLRASWAELRLPEALAPTMPVPPAVALSRFVPPTPSGAPTPTPTIVVNAERPATPAPYDPRRHIDLALAARFFPTYASTVMGPDAVVSLRVSRRIPLRLRLGAVALFGTTYDPLGSISARLLMGGAALVLAHSTGPVDVEIGPHVELGAGWLGGSATVSNVHATAGSAPVLTTSGQVTLRIPLLERFTANVAADVGSVLVGFGAQTVSGRVGGFGGTMAGVALGVGRGF